MENQNQQGIVEIVSEKIWKFFSSVKLAVVLLIILAVVSVIGTVIQQNQAPEEYLREYSPATVQLFETLGFFDLYHTWWFVLILLLFTANLTICTLERFPTAWKVMRAPLKPLEEAGYKAAPFKQDLVVADRDGSNVRVIFPADSQLPGLNGQVGQMAWSPDGRQLAFIYLKNLWIVDVETGVAHQLTQDGGASNPIWAR